MRRAVLLLSVFLVASCAKKESLSTIARDTTASINTQATGDAVNAVASDKELLRQALVLADSKGTLEAALTEAAQDSLVGIKMRSALILGNEAKSRATPPPPKGSAPAPAHPGKPTSAKQKGDVLDKANQTVDKANQTLDKTGTLLDKTNEATKKAGDILNGRR